MSCLKNSSIISFYEFIEVNNHEIKIAQYADDTSVFICDRESVLELLNFFEEFSFLSGLEINTSKTEAMWLGQWKNNQDTPFGFKWPKDPILSLGVFFSHNETDADEPNFDTKIRDLEKALQMWHRRNLTLYRKINIVKTLGPSKLIFNSSGDMKKRTLAGTKLLGYTSKVSLLLLKWSPRRAVLPKLSVTTARQTANIKRNRDC